MRPSAFDDELEDEIATESVTMTNQTDKSREAFNIWFNDPSKGEPSFDKATLDCMESSFCFGYQASESRILAMLESVGLKENIAIEIRNTELEARLNPHEYLDGSRALAQAALTAIKEAICKN